jgi:hypothetical protein
MKFEIDESFLTSVNIYKEWSMFKHIAPGDLTPEQVFKMIKGEDRCSSLSSDDHPEFKKLREQLGTDGYIEIERRWWNGDRVTKTFTLNGAKFKKDEQFPSGCAMSGHLKFTKKFRG